MPKHRARKTRTARTAQKSKHDGSHQTIARKPLAHEVLRVIREREMTQVAAGVVVGEQQSQISLVASGRLDGFSPERLIRMLTRLGRNVDVVIRRTSTARPGRVRVVAGKRG
jgi:predicted XRE-type DNA-binding protein